MGDSNKKFIIISILLVLIIGVIFILNKDTEKVQLDEVRLNDNGNNSKKMFAIMLEKTDNSNEYEESNNFPSTGYLYNGERSGCIDGNNKAVEDVLTYNEETKKVSVKTKQSVYCYLYFKKDSEVPDVTNFYVGTHHGSEYTNVNTNKTVHIEWNDEDVEEYCIKEETENNDSSNCDWKSIEELSPVDLEASHKVETTIDLGIENKKYDYDVFLKDRAGNESTVDEMSEDEIILDTQAPTISNISQVGEAKETSIEVSVTVNDPKLTDGTAGSGVEHIYYQIKEKNGNVIGSETDANKSTTHTFNSNLKAGTEYTVEVHAKDLAGNDSAISTQNFTTKELLKASEMLKKKVNQDGLKQTTGKGDLEYRYVGKQTDTVNNYVCFGAASCPSGETDNHMYRIIGITSDGKIKIQKNSSITTSQWASNSDIKWPNSTMYTSTLTSTFYGSTTYVTESMKSKIEENHTWNTGDVTDYSSATSGSYGTKIYEQENTTTSHTGGVGLAYASDYFFAYNEDGAQNCVSTNPYCKSWMVPSNYKTLWSSQSYEWTMTRYGRYSTGSYYAWYVYSGGRVHFNSLTNTFAFRPVFYLKSDVTITSGSGTLSSPYIIN